MLMSDSEQRRTAGAHKIGGRCAAATASILAAWLSTPIGVEAAVPGRPPDVNQCLSIAQYGARTDGSDATGAIQNTIQAAKSIAARCVRIPSGTYNITRIVIDGGVKMIGSGDASVLYARDPNNRQVKLDGANAGIYALKLLTYGNQRTNEDEAVWIEEGASNWVVHNVTIDGGNGPGIITYGGRDGRITANRVYNTRSDSIHISGGAHHIYIAGNKVRNSGDDCIAVVTYAYHPVNTYQVLIENNDVADQPWGRGISVVGGENVTIRRNKITRSSDAGIYIAAESSWATRGVRNVVVQDNTIDRSPQAHPEHGQTSILVYSDNNFWTENVLLTGNKITNAVNGPLRVEPHNTRNIACSANTYNGWGVTHGLCTGNASSIGGTTVTSALLGGGTVGLPK